MQNNPDISIIGFSVVGAITSLLLADKGVRHTYHIKKVSTPFVQQKPISNPLINGPTRNVEAKFLHEKYLHKVPCIQKYEAFSLHENFEQYRQTKGNYTSETYALDNRLRLECFYNSIKENNLITLIEQETTDNIVNDLPAEINLLGGGNQCTHFFKNIETLDTIDFSVKRDLFFFNLSCQNDVYEKYKNRVLIFYISNVGEILIYPFLHPTHQQTINITVNIIKGGEWDCFKNMMNTNEAFNKLLILFANNLPELASDFENAVLADDYFNILNAYPYYRKPVAKHNDKSLVGLGEYLTKSDPVLGQGYNSGVDLSMKLIENICNIHNTDISLKSYEEYAEKTLTYLYHINKTFTQKTENNLLSEVYDLATRNTHLKNFLFATYDDISLYFPWLINETETRKLIQQFEK